MTSNVEFAGNGSDDSTAADTQDDFGKQERGAKGAGWKRRALAVFGFASLVILISTPMLLQSGPAQPAQLEHDSKKWKLLAKITGEDDNEWSGWSVSLSADGSIVAIGAPSNKNGLEIDTIGAWPGQVRVYQFDGGAWNRLGGAIGGLFAGTGAAVSLSADGHTVAMGSMRTDCESDPARVFAYEEGVGWTQKGEDIKGVGFSPINYKIALLSSDGNAVGVHYERSTFVSRYDASLGWQQLGNKLADEGNIRALSADGTVAVIVRMSAACVYKYDKLEGWMRLGHVVKPGTPLTPTEVSLSSDGVTATISLVWFRPIGSSLPRGIERKIHVYKFHEATGWTQQGEDKHGESPEWSRLDGVILDEDSFNCGMKPSFSSSADGSVLAIGNPCNDSLRGSTHIYKLLPSEV